MVEVFGGGGGSGGQLPWYKIQEMKKNMQKVPEIQQKSEEYHQRQIEEAEKQLNQATKKIKSAEEQEHLIEDGIMEDIENRRIKLTNKIKKLFK